MFTASEIARLLSNQPFQPVRLHMTNGDAHEVNHPEMVIVTRNYVEVPTGVDADRVAESVSRLAVLHIVKIEEIPQPA